MKKWQRLTVILGLVGMSHACTMQQKNTTNKVNPQVAVVEPAPVVSVVALGQIEPEGEVIKLSVPNAQDSRVNKILVKEGDFVKANQVIAILQGIDRLEADLRDAEADVRLRQAELLKVQQGDAKKAEIAAQEANILRQEAQLKAETQQKKAAILSTEAILREAQLNYQRRQSLATEGVISVADADAARRELETSQAALMGSEAELKRVQTTLQAEINQQKSILAQLQEIRPVDVEIAKAQLEKAKIAVLQRKARLEDAQVRAPLAGQVLRINTRIGEQVNTSQGIVELARTNRMFAVAEVAETDIDKVRRGQKAVISSEYGGFNGEIQGNVEQISLQIGKRTLQDASQRGPTTDDNSRVVTVRVRIDSKYNSVVAALTYMLVRVKIDVNASRVMNAL
jgi:HlyD family secretion protein